MGYKVYSTEGCANCVKAIELLQQRGEPYEVIKLEENEAAMKVLMALGLRSVPQVCDKAGQIIPGGYEGLKQHLSDWHK